jgi:hypothetical protein
MIPRVTAMKLYSLTTDNSCLGFQITYWDGSAYQSYLHARADIESTADV